MSAQEVKKQKSIDKPVYQICWNILRIYKKSRISIYSFKFVKKDLQSAPIIDPILLKKNLSENYQNTVDLVDLMNEIKQRLNLDSIPHFTTLHKFSQRIDSFVFTRLLNRLIKCSMIGVRE